MEHHCHHPLPCLALSEQLPCRVIVNSSAADGASDDSASDRPLRRVKVNCVSLHDFCVHKLFALIGQKFQGDFPLVSICQPSLAHQRDFSAAVWVLARERPRPNVADRDRAIRVVGIELGKFLLRLVEHPISPSLDGIQQLLPELLRILQNGFQNQNGNGVVVQSVSFATEPKGFQRDRTATGKTIQNFRRLRVNGAN